MIQARHSGMLWTRFDPSHHLPPNVRHSLYDILLKMALLLLRRSFLCLWCCGGKLLMLSLSAMLRGLFHQCLYWFLSRNNSICALTTATYTYSSVLTKEARGTLKSPAPFCWYQVFCSNYWSVYTWNNNCKKIMQCLLDACMHWQKSLLNAIIWTLNVSKCMLHKMGKISPSIFA